MPSQDAPLPSMRVDGRVALVTGAGSGLGRSIALALAQAGASLVVTDLPARMGNARQTQRGIRKLGRESLAVSLNVTSLKSIERMVEKAVDRFGRIDILVNNAGINISKPALEVTEQDWDRVLDVNLKGVFFCSQAVARGMIQQKSGKIVNVASQNGVIGYYNRAAYCSSKAGVVNLTRVLAIEWASRSINVNAIGPTFVRTPLTEKAVSGGELQTGDPEPHTAGTSGEAGRRCRRRGLSVQSGSGPDHGAYVAGGRRLDGDLIEAGFAGLPPVCRHGGYWQPNRG